MTIFAKRHYEWLAKALGERQAHIQALYTEEEMPWFEHVNMVCDLADKLAAENPLFNRKRFLDRVTQVAQS